MSPLTGVPQRLNTMTMARFICWYAYKGQETEGRLDLEEPQIFEAVDEAEAMWKFHLHRDKSRGYGKITDHYKDLDDFRERAKPYQGWGLWCEQLLK
jgi:hypothetical protein